MYAVPMPRRKPQAAFDGMDESSETVMNDIESSEKQPRGKHRPNIRIPVNEEGVIDMSRVKDPAQLEKARIALGMPAGGMDTAPVEVQIPDEMLPLIPHLFDGLAYVIKFGLKMAKFPKAFTEEQRTAFRDCLRYSDKFKKEATEPTARLLQKAAGNSAITQWLMRNSDVAIFLKLLGEGTYEMITRGAQEFAQQVIAKQTEQAEKTNGGFPASEFRSVPQHEGAMEQ